MNDCARCGHDPCTCFTAKSIHPSTVVRSTERLILYGMTLDEFGIGLFATSKICSSLMTVDALHIRAIRKEDLYAQQECLRRRQALRQQLSDHIGLLNEENRLAIIQRYPVASHV